MPHSYRVRGVDWRSFGMSTFDLVARIAFGLFVPLSIATPLLRWAIHHRVGNVAIDGAAAVVMLFVGQEFCSYWYHRAAHRVRWFWLVHSVHHSPNELTLAAAFRIGIFGKMTGTSLFFVPLVRLGVDVRTVFSVLTLNLRPAVPLPPRRAADQLQPAACRVHVVAETRARPRPCAQRAGGGRAPVHAPGMDA